MPYREPLFRELAARDGLEVTVLYQSGREPGWDVPSRWFPAEHPYPARHLRSWQHARPGRTPIVWPRGLERALSDAAPDCVVAWEYGPASLRAFAWSRAHRRAFVIFTECTPRIDAMLSASQLRLHRWLARRADGLIATSSAARARLEAFGVPGERIEVSLQSADVARFRKAAEHARAGSAKTGGDHPITVLTVGRLVPDKNLGSLLEAFDRAGLTAAEASLEIVGVGFLQEQLSRRARELGVPVSFRGHLATEELPPLFAAADLYAQVSTYEPFGVVLREAAAAGLPLLCTVNAGAVGDVALDGENALLVDPESVEEIAAGLRRLVDDTDLRRRLSAGSRAVDAATDGRDVEAFAEAILAAVRSRGQ
jgi:glycosyltransferase involved in cell wall biosynthesis